MLGIIPAAGAGSRIQPLAFSKELLPIGSRHDGPEERPKAVSEYLVDRMNLAGATRICFVISPRKSDIVEYFGESAGSAAALYAVQNEPRGLCDALFRAMPLVDDKESILIGLPDTVWFPENGLSILEEAHEFSLLLFPVERPQLFDAVVVNKDGWVDGIQVKSEQPTTRWIWGALRLKGTIFRHLYELWKERGCEDRYLGTLINSHLAQGHRVRGVPAGRAYVDVGTLHGYREAIRLLADGELSRSVTGPALERTLATR
jgi:glucose-1-phosphate thymidylyltransferase